MGSKQNRADAEYASVVSLSTACSVYRLTLSTTTAATATVTAGRYVVALYTTGGVAYATFAATATLPTSGAAATSAYFALRDGEIVKAPGALAVAVILTGGTGELALTKVE